MRKLIDQASPLPSRKVVAATLGAVFGSALAHWSGLAAGLSPWLAWLDSEPARLAAPVLGAALAGYLFREGEG